MQFTTLYMGNGENIMSIFNDALCFYPIESKTFSLTQRRACTYIKYGGVIIIVIGNF